MNEAVTRLPVKTERNEARKAVGEWQPLGSLRREIDRLFDDVDRSFWRWPFRRSSFDLAPTWSTENIQEMMPAVDIAEKDKQYEITAELPGMDQNNIDVTLSNGVLTIKGEKKEEKEEKKKDYYMSERRYGSFQRSFQVPEGVSAEKVEANFKNGILTVTLPKTVEAQKQEKKIAIKAA